MSDIKLEVCVDDISSFDAAIAGGADRIELCASLALGGLTPSLGLVKYAARAPIPVYAMIRPRAGDFVFSDDETTAMFYEIDMVREAKLAGVVLGASKENGQLDMVQLKRLHDHAADLGTTLHRAIDLVPDFAEAVEIAIEVGFERILSSGGEKTALTGIQTLQHMAEIAKGRISIMPGSGISVQTAPQILAQLTTREIHASCAFPNALARSKLTELGFSTTIQRKTTAASVAALKDLIHS